LLKLAPDLTERELDQALTVITANHIDGIIATNTTMSRPQLRSEYAPEIGGLSGVPLGVLARKVIGYIFTHTQGKLPIVATGGIMSRQDAEAALNAGASLVQIFTGMIFRGPGFVKEILEGE